MNNLKISELIPHPQNDYFFDDITGDAWEEFLQSIETSGVIEPIVVTQNKVIVSGHQRVRACKVLGIKEIQAEVRIIESDDEILKQLIETNIRQRGIGNTNPVKFGRCIKELERIYGIRDGSANEKGNNRIGEPNYSDDQMTQEDLAKQFGISTDTLHNYKLLAEMIPEMQDLVDTGIVTPTTARAIVRQLPEDQQRELANQFASQGEKVTGKAANEEIEKLKSDLKDLQEERDYLTFQLEEEKTKDPQTVEKKVVPEDYESLKTSVEDYKKDYASLESDFNNKVKELNEIKAKLKTLEESSTRTQYDEKLKNSCLIFCSKVADFLEKVGGYVWLTDHINELPNLEREGYIKSVNAIKSWADNMDYNINNKIKEIA